MTVRSLRALARKVLGPGHSRLRTKSELVAALEQAERKVGSAVEKAGAQLGRATKRATDATGKAMRAARGAGKPAAAAPKATATATAKPRATAKTAAGRAVRKVRSAVAAAVSGAAAGSLAARGRKARRGVRAEETAAVAAAEANERNAVVPDPEGYFVARVRGEDAVRDAPHPMSESVAGFRGAEGWKSGERYEEHLGELSSSYRDDVFVALPRDPRTLFVYWDHAEGTRARAFEGLEDPRAQLWVFARADGGWERTRAMEFALESRSYYVHDLVPGQTYRAEIHAVDRAGRTRPLGEGSNEVQLPPFGPSPVVDDRFVRLPWSLPLGRLLGPGHPGTPFSEEARQLLAQLSDWRRFSERPGSERAGQGLGELTPSGAPSFPSSPTGPFGGGGR